MRGEHRGGERSGAERKGCEGSVWYRSVGEG